LTNPTRPGSEPVSAVIDLDRVDHIRQLVGERGANLRLVEKHTGAQVSVRGNRLTITGREAAVSVASRALTALAQLIDNGYPLMPHDIQKTLDMVLADKDAGVYEVFTDTISIPSSSRHVAPKSPGQKTYVQAMRDSTVVFAIGPAGTGKTYLAVAMAASALFERQCKRIVLTRPAVEAGEKLGFLPGDIAEKVNPYLRPLYDALEDMTDIDRVKQFIARGVIEVAPLAFMRGRSLNDSFVILDEAQNTTPEQMKMFLTRLGFNSRAVITGDITQVDLPPDRPSGLVHATHILEGMDGISVCRLTSADVVRHPLVARIIDAYDRDDSKKKPTSSPGSPGR
jgi:phosphate starvation-inducible PhoH-like protein